MTLQIVERSIRRRVWPGNVAAPYPGIITIYPVFSYSFSDEQLYSVVSDVKNYEKFLPWCTKSHVYDTQKDFLKGDLVIGFPPLTERYTSHVTLRRPNYIRADCTDGRLFSHFLTTWQFGKGLKDIPQSAVIDIDVQFEFKSAMYSNLAHIFFDQVVKQMEEAFLREAKVRFGAPVIKTHILSYHTS